MRKKKADHREAEGKHIKKGKERWWSEYTHWKHEWKFWLQVEQNRDNWALSHSSSQDMKEDNIECGFHKVVYADKTPAKTEIQWDFFHSWRKKDKVNHKDVQWPQKSNTERTHKGSLKSQSSVCEESHTEKLKVSSMTNTKKKRAWISESLSLSLEFHVKKRSNHFHNGEQM